MSPILLFCNILVLSAVVSGSLFYNQYPEIKFTSDSRESGDALFLTKYLENGDIKTVSYTKMLKKMSCGHIKIHLIEHIARRNNCPW